MIQYTYEIRAVDSRNRVMEVLFSSFGRPSVTVSTRIPFANETMEDYIKTIAPLQMWEDMDKPVHDIVIGQGGVIRPVTPAPTAPASVVVPTTVIQVDRVNHAQ